MGDHERQDVTENLDLTLRQTSSSSQFELSVWRNVGRNVARSYLDMNGQPGSLELLSNGYVRHRGIDQSELWPLPLSRVPSMSFESGNVALASVGYSRASGGRGSDDDEEVLQVREESVTVAERNENDADDIDEVTMAVVEGEVEDKKEDVEDGGIHDGGYFDCSICLDMAKDPIVTCCGHLFCWPCIYRWLYGHSDERECPVCKGAISVRSVIPIYGRGKNITRATGVDLGIKIPPRPSAQTVQKEVVQRTTLTSPFERELWTLGFDSLQSFERIEPDGPARNDEDLLNDIESTLMHSVQAWNANNTVDLTQRREELLSPIITSPELVIPIITAPHSPFSYGRAYSQFYLSAAFVPSVGSAGETADTYRPFAPLSPRRQQQLPSTAESRESFSSAVAFMTGESQSVDTAAEINSGVLISTSSSGQRDDASGVSYVEIGNSRRRRRLN